MKSKPTFVYIVSGGIAFEGIEPIAVTTSKKLADTAIQSDQAIREVTKATPFDYYDTKKFLLDKLMTRKQGVWSRPLKRS